MKMSVMFTIKTEQNEKQTENKQNENTFGLFHDSLQTISALFAIRFERLD